MREFVVAITELFAYVVGTGIFLVLGVFAEISSLSYLSAGNQLFAGWLALMGVMALYAAYSVGTERVIPRISNLQS